MSAAEFFPFPEKAPETQSATSGGPPGLPPKPPKFTARDLVDPGGPDKTIFLADYVIVKELAELLALKPFKVVADILELRKFRNADEFIDFSTAAAIAEKHGYVAKRIND